MVEAIHRFVAARGRPAVVYLLANDEAIGTSNVRELASLIDDLHFQELDLVLHSSGGDIHAAYQLITFLQRRAETLTACVPRYARSAATLLCVGAHDIVLDELAAVGPLDAQIYLGLTDDRRPNYESALNHFKSLERLHDFSLDCLRTTAAMLHEHQVDRPEDTLRYAIDFVRVTAAPLYAKIPTHRLGDYSQRLAIGQEYGTRLLKRVCGLDVEDCEALVRRLVNGYPSHEYVIDCEELAHLGLKASLFEGEQRRAARELARFHTRTAILLAGPTETVPEDERLRQRWGNGQGTPTPEAAFSARGSRYQEEARADADVWETIVAETRDGVTMRGWMGRKASPCESRNPWRQSTLPRQEEQNAPSRYFAPPGPRYAAREAPWEEERLPAAGNEQAGG